MGVVELTFTVLPAVDISEGRCVRLLQGRFGTERVYSDDPVKVALGFGSAGARWLHIVDLDGARTGEPANRELVLEVVRRSSCPVQAGGGVRSLEDVEDLVAAGANRAVLGTAALEDPEEAAKACKAYGERIAVSLDVRGTELTSRGWTVGTGMGVEDAVRVFEAAGVAAFVYTDTTRDGTLQGPDLDGLQRLLETTSLPVIASGGISSLDDLRGVARLYARGVRGAVIGRAFYENKFTVGEAQYAADEAAEGRAEEPLVEGGPPFGMEVAE